MSEADRFVTAFIRACRLLGPHAVKVVVSQQMQDALCDRANAQSDLVGASIVGMAARLRIGDTLIEPATEAVEV